MGSVLKNKNSFPLYVDHRENYLREEADGNYSLILYSRPEFSLISINKTAKKIIELCNGQNSIQDIVEVMKESYLEADSFDIEADVDRTIHLLWRLGTLELLGENYITDKYERVIDGVKYKYLNEDEAKEFWSVKLKKGIVNPYINVSAEYTPVETGVRWFNGTESFISVSEDECDVLRMAVRINPYLKVYDIAMITYENIAKVVKLFPAAIQFMHNNYVEVLHYDLFSGGKPIVQINSTSDHLFGDFIKLKGVLNNEVDNESVYLYEYIAS